MSTNTADICVVARRQELSAEQKVMQEQWEKERVDVRSVQDVKEQLDKLRTEIDKAEAGYDLQKVLPPTHPRSLARTHTSTLQHFNTSFSRFGMTKAHCTLPEVRSRMRSLMREGHHLDPPLDPPGSNKACPRGVM